MARKSAGFVSKKPHRKSRGGCLTCKRKKVKCDEALPACGYCALRKLECDYPPQSTSPPNNTTYTTQEPLHVVAYSPLNEINFNDTTYQIPSYITPAVHSPTGPLTPLELSLLHHYKTSTWQTFAVRGDEKTHAMHRDGVPQLSISNSHLLYALLSISASHLNSLQPSKTLADNALIYRLKTYQTYTKELQDIRSDNYESILVTGCYLLALIPPPGPSAADDEHLNFMNTLLKLSEGLRILVGLRWARGIEKLSVYPLICRELRTLPPPPVIKDDLYTRAGPLGTTPDHPNPAPTYALGSAHIMPLGGFVFLPPSLLALLESIMHPPPTSRFDLDANTLIPVFHIFSPVFLSLYYHHLNPDFNVRIFVFTSFLMPDFLALVKAREPRALVLMAWFFALADLIPHGWWVGTRVGMIVGALGRAVRERGDDGKVRGALEGAERIIELLHGEGRERAAESVFEEWEGVNWEDGPRKAEEWERELADLNAEGIDFGDLDLDIPT